MKQIQLLTAALIIFLAATITGCKTSRVWETKDNEDRTVRNTPAPAPRHYNPPATRSFSLIISPSPGFVMNRYADGRYYHRSQNGLLFWKGYDNRFYLDKSYLHRVSYSRWEYDEWKKYSRKRR